METFSQETMKHAPWSMSKAELALSCGFAYHQKYIAKAKGIPPKDSSSRIGIAAHSVLEAFLKNSSQPLKSILYNKSFEHKLTTPEFDDLVAFAVNIYNFKNRLDAYKTTNKVCEQKIEYKFGITSEMSPTEFFGKNVFFRGAIDLLMKTEDNYIVIIDHKTGNPPATHAEAMNQHKTQLKLYSLAAFLLYPQFKGIQIGLHYLANEEIIWNPQQVFPKTIQNEILTWYPQFLNSAGAAAEQVKAQTGWRCKFCEYTALCPLK